MEAPHLFSSSFVLIMLPWLLLVFYLFRYLTPAFLKSSWLGRDGLQGARQTRHIGLHVQFSRFGLL